jgi:DNA-binding NarL/FixJ family response regulator
LETSQVGILVVDDYEPFRRFIYSTLGTNPRLQIVGEASDGFEGVNKAEELQPNLVLLDIGLPTLNGIEAARQIRKLAPNSKIIFVSQESSADVVEEVLALGAHGFVVKAHAGGDLLAAVEAVLAGRQFLSNGLTHRGSIATGDTKITSSHEVEFYSNDAALIVGFTRFIEAAIKAGNAVIVVATESHRKSLLHRLQEHGMDISAAMEEGRYLSLDAADALSNFMVRDLPDPARFLQASAGLIATALRGTKGEQLRIAVCGECDPPLCTLRMGEAAIRLEELWNKVAETHDIDILCGYQLGDFNSAQGSHIFQRICAEHSSVHFL